MSDKSDLPDTRLELETGDTDRFARYAGDDAQHAFRPFFVDYNYTVQEGDVSFDLDYKDTASLYWQRHNGENIRSAYNFPHNCFLPEPGAAGSLSKQGDVRVVGIARSLVALADPPGGVYGPDREVEIGVHFGEPVAYSGGAPELALNVSGMQRTAAYKSGNGTAEFVFGYVVRPGDAAGDLDYYGTDSLTGAITNGTGQAVNRTLRPPGAPYSLSWLSDVAIDPAALPLIPAGRADNDMNNFDALDGATDVDAIAVGNRTYAVVASSNDDAVQLIRVHEDGTLEAAHSVSGGARTGPVLDYAHGIDAFYMGGGAYAIVAANGGNGGVQLLRIHGSNGTLSTVSSLLDYTANDDLELHGAIGVAAFEMNNTMHALVSSFWDDGIQLVRIDATTGALTAAGSLAISRAHGVAVFDLGGEKHALVTSRGGSGSVHLVSINATTGMLAAVSSLLDNSTLALGNPQRVSTFDLGGAMHALVASEADGGVQLIRIDADGTLAPAGSASDGDPGFAELGGAEGMAAFTGAAGAAYALVASRGDNGIQLVHVRGASGGDGGALAPAGWASAGDPGFDELDGAAGAAAFSMGGRLYAIVSSNEGDGVQLVRLTAASVVNVTSTAANGTYAPGDEIDIAVTFDHPVRVSGPVELQLNSGGSATYRSGNDTAELVFRYVVSPGDSAADLEYVGALSRNDSIRDGALPDLLVNHTLPPAGTGRSLGDLKDIAIESPPLSVAWVSSPNATGTYVQGDAIRVVVVFSEAVTVDTAQGRPSLVLETGAIDRSAAYVSGSGSPRLAFTYVVEDGDLTAPYLDYASRTALSANGATINASASGVAADLTLPPPGASRSLAGMSRIIVDAVDPAVVNASSLNSSAAYGLGETILVRVSFSEDVVVDGAPGSPPPLLALGTGGTGRSAAYASGSGTPHLVFAYTVGPGDRADDLGYAGTGALSGGIADVAGNAANLTLPAPGSNGSLSRSSDMLIDHALSHLIAAGSANDWQDGFDALAWSLDVDTIAVGGRTYAVVASHGDHAVQLIRVHEDGTMRAAGEARNGQNGFDRLGRAEGVDAFMMGAAAHAIAAAPESNGVQLIRIHENGTMEARGSLGENTTHNAGLVLKGAVRAAAFDMGGHAHALVAAQADDGVQLVRIHENGTLEPRGSLADDGPGGALELDGAYGVAAFSLGGAPHALVGGRADDGVQLVRIHENGTLEPRGSLGENMTHNAGLELDGPRDIAAFNLSGRGPHALVASEEDNGAQLVRIHENGTLEARGTAANGARGFDKLDDVYGVAAFELGGAAYAAVASRDEGGGGGSGGVQLVRVRESDGALLAAGSAGNGIGGFSGLGGARGIHAFNLDGRPHLIVASAEGHAVQLIAMSSASVNNVSSAAADGPHRQGDEIDIAVAFDYPVRVAGEGATPSLKLNSGGSALYRSGSDTTELVFRYTVQEGEQAVDLDYAGAGALSDGGGGSGTIVRAATGVPARLALPPPGSANSLGGLEDIYVDARPPSPTSVYASADGAYGIGDTVDILIGFDEPVAYSGGAPPELLLSVGGSARPPHYAPGNGTDELAFSYTVGPGDRTDDLDYAGTGALSGSVADLAGHPANLSVPLPGASGSLSHSSDVLIDPGVPRLIAAGSASDGDDGFGALSYSLDVDTIAVGGRTYAVVASHGDHAVQLIRVHEDGTMRAAGEARNGQNGFDRLGRAEGVDAFMMGAAAHAIAAAPESNGVQLVRIHENGTLEPRGSLGENTTHNAGLVLRGAQRVAAFDMGGHAHALVAAQADDGVQLVRIHENGTLEPRGSLADDGPGGTLELDGAYGVAAFSLGGRAPHALVGGHADHGVQLVRIHENGTLEPRGSLADDAGLELYGPRDIAAFSLGSRGLHAMVASEADHGVQLVRIHENGTLEPRGSLDDGDIANLELEGARGVAAFELGGGAAYAAVASRADGGVQLVRMREDGALLAAGSADSGIGGFGGLNGAFGIHAFSLDGRPHAIVASAEGSAVQLIGMSPAAVTSVSSAAADGAYALGDTIDVAVSFDRPVRVAADGEGGGTPLLGLNSGGSALYRSGSDTTELVFRYTVQEGEQAVDLDYAGAGALSDGGGGSGTIVHAASGIPARLALPPPGSANSLGGQKAISLDERPPSVESVFALSDGVYGAGRTVGVAVRFDERVAYSGDPPVLLLNVSGAPRAVPYESGNGTDTLEFSYAVWLGDLADDLGYAGTGALSGSVEDLAGHPADLLLPAPGSPGSLSRSSDVVIDPGAPRPIANGSAHDNTGSFGALAWSLDVDTIAVGGRTYAAVASHGDHAVQLIRVHENGTMRAVGEARNGQNGFDRLLRAEGIDAFMMGAAAHAIAAAPVSNGVQLIRIHENGTLEPRGSLGENTTHNAGLVLKGAVRAAAFDMGGHAHALVAAQADDGVQLVRIHENGTLEPRGSLADDGPGGALELDGAYGVAAFSLGGQGTHALVGGHADDGVQLIRIRADGTLEPRGSLADDGPGGALELDGPRDIAAFSLGGQGMHALVASEEDDGVQLIRIRADGTLEARGTAANSTRGFDRLGDVYGVAAFELGDGSAYAAVASRDEGGGGGSGGVQLVRVRESDGALIAAGSAGNGIGGFGGLGGARGIQAFSLDGRPHAIVASAEGHAVQLMRLSPAAVVQVASAAADGAYALGDTIDITVSFDAPVRVAGDGEGGTPLLGLNSGGSALYRSGNNTAELVFRYTVLRGQAAGDLDHDGAGALRGAGGVAIAEAGTGIAASTAMPPPGTGRSLGGLNDIAVDGVPPRAVSVSSETPDGAYGANRRIAVAVAFSEPVSYSGDPPVLSLNVGESARPASYDSGSGTAELVFAYTVGAGDRASDLAYAGTGALSGAIADAAGNAADLALPLPGEPGSLSHSADVRIDAVPPRVASVASPSGNGTYGAGDTVRILVRFTEPVLVDGEPVLALGAGAGAERASYSSGSGTDTLVFLYTVQPGDSAECLDYAGIDALSPDNGSVRDAAGNPANLSLAPPGSQSSLGGTGCVSLRGAGGPADATPAAPDAVFTAPNTIRIEYGAPLGPPAGHEGQVYGAVSIEGGSGPGGQAAATAASGLGTAAHTVGFGGAGAAPDQRGGIELAAGLRGTAPNGTSYALAAGTIIPVRPGAEARTLAPPGEEPVVAIGPGSFVRVVDASGGSASARPAIDVTALFVGEPAPGTGARTAEFPAGIRLAAPFAGVSFPPGVAATSVPADGLIELYVSGDRPAAEQVAAALGVDASLVAAVGTVVEVGDSAARISFDMPVRVRLDGQAGARAFYVDGAGNGGEVAPIRTACAADDTAAVHSQLGGSGECWLDRDGDKVVHTYHLTRFGTAVAPTLLEAMVAGAAAGSAVRVPPGTYAEDVLAVDRPLTIEPEDPENPPVFTGTSRIVVAASQPTTPTPTTPTTPPPQAAGGPVVIRGLVFEDTEGAPDGGNPASITVESPSPGASASRAPMPVTIEGNTFRNTCGAAVRAAPAAGGAGGGAPALPIEALAIKNNRFYDIGGNRASCGAGSGGPPALADAIVAGRHAGGSAAAAGAAAPQLAGMTVRDNYIFGTTYTGIRIAGADGLLVTGNHIEGVPDDGMRIVQSRNVQVHLNTIVGANQAPRAAAADAPHDGTAGAAIEVWSGSDNVAATLNRISESAGAFLVCAGTCDPGPDAAGGPGGGPVQADAVPVNAAGGASDIRFTHNVLAGSNTGTLIANSAGGELDARANYWPGHAESAAERVSPAGAVLHEPALGDAGPVRIGAVVADAPASPIRSVDAAVRAALVLGVHDFNAAQARAGGAVGLEPAVHAVDSPGYAAEARAAHAAAVASLRSGSSADGRMLPVLHNSISSAMALYDASGDAALAAISAMRAAHAHYPFVVNLDGTIAAHGANASLAGGRGDRSGGGDGVAAAAAADLLDFGPAGAGAGAAAGTGVDPGHPDAPWKWRAHESVDPATGAAAAKRSVLALHPGPDGVMHNGDDLVFGAGYHPGPGAAHLVVAAGDAAAAAAAAAGSGAIVAVSPASTASQLAARDALFRLAPPDGRLAGVVIAQALADRQGAAPPPLTIVALNDSASLQSMGLAGELYEIDLQGALPDGVDRVAAVSYNSSSQPPPPADGAGGGAWAAAAADAIRAAASESRGDAAVVYSGRAGAFAALADALGGQPPPNSRWYSTGELARAELAASGPAAAALARSGQLASVLQYAAVPNAEIDAALAAPGTGIVLDESTRGPAYAAYDAPALLGRAMASTPGVPGAPAAIARAIDEDVARTHAGALGSPLILDRNGDLVLPIAYAVSAFPASGDPGGAWGQLDTRIGERACGIALAKGALDFGILSLGRYSRPDTQTVINTGTLPYRSVTLDPGDWTYASGQTLPASITELRELGRAAAYAGAASGFVVAPGLAPGQDSDVQFRINLTAYQSLPPGEASQTINYLVECRAAAAGAG